MIRKFYRFFLTGCLFLLLLSCAGSPKLLSPYYTSSGFAIVPPIYLHNILMPEASALDIFEANLYAGSVSFSGGIVTDPARGNITRAKNIDFKEEALHKQAVSSMLVEALSGAWSAVSGGSNSRVLIDSIENLTQDNLLRLATVSKTMGRGDTAVAGKDNINQPYWVYTIQVDPDIKDFLQTLSGRRDGLLCVPVVEYAYSHNAGWFYDQYVGTLAGVRLAVQIFIFDVSTGQLVLHRREEHRVLPGQNQLSMNTIRELFMDLAAVLQKSLGKVL